MEVEEIARVLEAAGCPAEKRQQMAAQLDKRARQLANEKGRTYEEALAYLLSLVRQGRAGA